MNTITKIDAVPLAIGIQKLLLEMVKESKDPRYPVALFEQIVMTQHKVNLKAAELVTEKVLGTGIIRWELGANCFVL